MFTKRIEREKQYILKETERFWDDFEHVDEDDKKLGEGYASEVIRVKKIDGDGTVYAGKFVKQHAYWTIENELGTMGVLPKHPNVV